jgi:fibronectin-binding autotransporter adhesin
LDLNDFTLTAFTVVSSGTLARQIQFGNTGAIDVTASGQTIWSFGTSTGFSYTGNGRVNLTYAGAVGTRIIAHGSTAGGSEATQAPPMYVAAGATDTITTTNLGYWSDLVFAAGANVTLSNTSKFVSGNVILAPGMTITAGTAGIAFIGNGIQTLDTANITLDFPLTIGSGTSNGNLRLANTTTMGNTRLATLTSGTLDLNGQTLTVGTWGSTNTNTRAIHQNGGTFNVAGFNTTVWLMSTSTGFSYPTRPVVNLTYNGSVGTRSLGAVASGGTANNSIDFNIVAGSDSFVMAGVGTNNLNCVGFTGTLTNQSRSLYGNLTLDPGMTATAGINTTTFIGTTGNQTLVTNGVATDFPITINSTGGNFVLSEPLSIGSSRVLTVTAGNLLANGYGITTGQLAISNSNLRTLDIGNITLNLSGTGTVFTAAVSDNLTLNTANSTVLLSNNTTAARIFASGGLTYNNLVIGGNTATSNTSIFGNTTFNTISSTKTVAHRVIFGAGTTTTMENFTVSGTASNLVTITSDTANVHNLVLTGAGTVNTVSYLNISYSNASPAVDTWFAGTNSIDSGNNTGWIFPAPAGGSNFFLMF